MPVLTGVKAKLRKAKEKAVATARKTSTQVRKAGAAVNDLPAKVQRVPRKLQQAKVHHDERHRPSGFSFALADAVAMLNPEHWDALTVSASVYFGRDYLQALEASLPGNLRPHYAIVYRDAKPVAAVVAQSVDVRGDALPRQRAKTAIRRPLSRLKERILVCGNLLSWGSHGVAFAADEDAVQVWPGVAEALYRIRRADKLLGETSLVWVKDLSPEAHATAAPLARFQYRAFETEPNMVLPLKAEWTSFEDYLLSLKSAYRSSIKKVRKDFDEAGFIMERLDAVGVANARDTIHGLYHQVHDNQKFRLATLHENYIPQLAKIFGNAFRTHLARDGAGRAVGFITTLKDRDGAIGYYIGFDKAAATAGAPIYLRLLQQTIEDAIALEARWLSLGRTALHPKAQLGAKPVPVRGHIRHRVPAMNALMHALVNFMPEPDQAPERSAFK